ncbi:hypothetical protein I545_0739 [Mycobacterium kansasii 662]|uniref:Uncharacterized protein n=2 Tax=Mycobacterium kansasii TaxID=1768 RepID=A0A1V3XR00_MYCKA|nr:hypothetical protein I547_0585 [Mycobacterium kansasii 824]EUA22096.1 hypothetical protein I545_0739 [Mycobacterium kansasii 662]OOK81657.1 hypothetical protein BZL30_1037 [Mycobacterium kansasii]
MRLADSGFRHPDERRGTFQVRRQARDPRRRQNRVQAHPHSMPMFEIAAPRTRVV